MKFRFSRSYRLHRSQDGKSQRKNWQNFVLRWQNTFLNGVSDQQRDQKTWNKIKSLQGSSSQFEEIKNGNLLLAFDCL